MRLHARMRAWKALGLVSASVVWERSLVRALVGATDARDRSRHALEHRRSRVVSERPTKSAVGKSARRPRL